VLSQIARRLQHANDEPKFKRVVSARGSDSNPPENREDVRISEFETSGES
jgi:hypothetical protein